MKFRESMSWMRLSSEKAWAKVKVCHVVVVDHLVDTTNGVFASAVWALEDSCLPKNVRF